MRRSTEVVDACEGVVGRNGGGSVAPSVSDELEEAG